MNAQQTARFNAYSLALAHLKEHESITKKMPAFERAYNSARAKLDEIEAANIFRSQKLPAITAGKRQYLFQISSQAHIFSSAIVTCAAEKNNPELKEAMSFTHSELFFAPANKLGPRVASILEMAKKHAEELKEFGITEEMLSQFTRQAEQFISFVNRPREIRSEQKIAGTKIKEGLNQLKSLLEKQLDGLMLHFRKDHPEFYRQYIEKRNKVNPAVRRTRLLGFIIDEINQKGIGNARISLKGTEFSTVTDADGSFNMMVPPHDAAEVVFEKEGYETITLVMDLKRGKSHKQKVQLRLV